MTDSQAALLAIVPECDRTRVLAAAEELEAELGYSAKVALESAVMRYRRGEI